MTVNFEAAANGYKGPYRDLLAVYRALLVRARYHIMRIAVTRRVLTDIVYDKAAAAGRLDARYFSVYLKALRRMA